MPLVKGVSMVKGPYSHGKTPDEVAQEVRVYLARIGRRRRRFRSAEEKNLREVRKRVAEAVESGISAEEAAAAVGYKLMTVTRWLAKAKRKGKVRALPKEKARERLDRIRARRRRTSQAELKVSAMARATVRKAMEAGIAAQEFADTTGYTLKIVTKWFVSVRRSLEQAQRQREIVSVRHGKRNRPPQHLSLVEYDQWLVQEDRRRKTVLRRHGLSPRRRKPGGRQRKDPAPRIPKKPRKRPTKRGRKPKKK
jgi:hypothetical protein